VNWKEKVTVATNVAVPFCCFPALPKRVQRVEPLENKLTKCPVLFHKGAGSIHHAVLRVGNIGSADRLICLNLRHSWKFPGFNLRYFNRNTVIYILRNTSTSRLKKQDEDQFNCVWDVCVASLMVRSLRRSSSVSVGIKAYGYLPLERRLSAQQSSTLNLVCS